jgi:transcriptional antiterminator RfaH
MGTFKQGWYVIYTKPRQERKVAEQLSRKNISYFLPIVSSVRQWHDRKKVVQVPLFPSYVFVNLTGVTQFFDGMESDGVCCYVRVNREPAVVPQTVIEQIDLVVRSGQNVDVSSERFHSGQQVLICHGALTGLSGEVIQSNGKEKVLVRVSILNRNILVDLQPSSLTSKMNH